VSIDAARELVICQGDHAVFSFEGLADSKFHFIKDEQIAIVLRNNVAVLFGTVKVQKDVPADWQYKTPGS